MFLSFDDIYKIVLGVVTLVVFVIKQIQTWRRDKRTDEKVDKAEERVIEHPGKPELAWDLARTKLESYLDRNLSQGRSIFWLTVVVMASGFALISYAIYKAVEAQGNITIAVVGSASGVLVSFIGGSFLVVYRSILTQSKEYVTVLERINAVGMAVQVLSGIPDENAELKHKTTALLAGDLIKLYGGRASPSTSSEGARSIRAKASRK